MSSSNLTSNNTSCLPPRTVRKNKEIVPINALWKLHMLPEVKGAFILTYDVCHADGCLSWACKGFFFFSPLPQSPFSVAPSRRIKCNLGTVPGSLFKA